MSTSFTSLIYLDYKPTISTDLSLRHEYAPRLTVSLLDTKINHMQEQRTPLFKRRRKRIVSALLRSGT